jgi:hypothetical protein
MFEPGARPYPLREVYQQYLAQSDVFIGLYWQRYGQPAGLEPSAEANRCRLALSPFAARPGGVLPSGQGVTWRGSGTAVAAPRPAR